ncbi:uncharacterized protein LOC117878498 isoform X2 [Trachemys scripta elegans]|uniref:uncharacterized protein LOC117878498 isoform X2 n=1 Tax=Trachemys scripta elegans TaxID=31138 RepID=UPI001556ED38|nr:uncharacterized protein LOC117878498 isoform X2 [Trachemys scripta elegans]XP_042706263.1 uncharacterized protein LOC101932292 isoform X2 [Chrysemys picta bellii]
MDRYRYFIFNQKSMVVLGFLQIACAAVCVISGLMDGTFRTESALSKSRAPVWAGMVNAMIVASIFSCFATIIVVVYASLTLSYGEEDEMFTHEPVHVIHTKFVLDKLVKGANIAMLIASTCSAFIVLVIAYMGCRSLPRCSCYDNVTGMEWLQPAEDPQQTVELVCTMQSHGNRIFNSPVQFPDQDLDAEEELSKPPPYIRLA